MCAGAILGSQAPKWAGQPREHLECQLHCQLCVALGYLPGSSQLPCATAKGHLQKGTLFTKQKTKVDIIVVCVNPPKLRIQEQEVFAADVALVVDLFRSLLLAAAAGSFAHQVCWSCPESVCTEHFAPALRGIRSFECLQGPAVLHKTSERQWKWGRKCLC